MDTPNKQFCFTHPGGEDIYLFRLYNSIGTEVFITNYGAIITSFKVKQKNGTVSDIVLGFDKVETYLSKDYLDHYPYLGAAIGRYGNRIKSGKFTVDAQEYTLATNLGTEHLHGGNVGFDKRVWTLESVTDSVLVLKYESPDGEEGYPGNLDVTLKFELTDDNELIHEYSAFTDMPTPVNLTHHSYFNLTNGDGTVGDTIVKINASYTLAQDDTSTVTGELLPVDNTRFDFRKPRRIDTNWNPETGYDQSFVVDKKENTPEAEAWSEKSGIKLQVFTTEPIVHLYTAKYLSPMKGKGGKQYGPFSGFCLETQIHPNAINIPSFPDTILRPRQEYKHKTVYKIIV